ncbi:circadian clock KaiB family protein [Variovorax sp. RB2P76]|uniref:circadian clock KaiB family protein n=1 Tax=unclassified Variovorax TaxID=663243 RepID=UPI003F4585E6
MSEEQQTGAISGRQLELYVAGDTLPSNQARGNLEEIVRQLEGPTTVTVIDVQKDAKAAFARRIFATPSLVCIHDEQKVLIIGNLSDREGVIQRLSVR